MSRELNAALALVRTNDAQVTRQPDDAQALDDNCAEFNQKHACVTVGANVRVLVVREDGYDLMRLQEFKAKYDNRTIRKGTRLINAAEAWWTHQHRRTFDRIVFRPGESETDDGQFNMWRGFAVTAQSGSCQRYLDHLRNNIAQNDAQLYDWVLSWLANLVQHPMRKPGTALILRGKQGVGKSIVGRPFADILGRRHYVTVASDSLLTGRFNSHLEASLLVQMEEGFWAGNKAAESAIKHLVTGETQQIERKGVDSLEVPNFVRVLITSNATWVVPAAAEERRYAVLDVGSTCQQDAKYFAAICEELDNGGSAALLHFLLMYSYNFETIKRVPDTAALAEQKRVTMDGPHSWLLDVLTAGNLPGEIGHGLSLNSALYDHYITAATKLGIRHRSAETELGMMLHAMFPEIDPRRVVRDGGRVYVRQFPRLEVCRARFNEVTGVGIAFDDPTADWGGR